MEEEKDRVPEMLAMPPPPLVATVQQPDTLAQVAALMPKDGDASMATVLLALVGVAGSGALVKLYRDWQKSRHEENMKRLEIEEKKAERGDDQHKECALAREALEAKIEMLEGKLSQMEQKSLSLSVGEDFDPKTIEARLKKLEKRQVAARKKKE